MEATTSPLTLDDSFVTVELVVMGVGVILVDFTICDGVTRTAEALFLRLLLAAFCMTDCLPKPNEAIAISKSNAAK